MAEHWLQNSPRPRWLLGAVTVVWLTSAVLTLPACLRQTNAHTEDQLLHRAAATLPHDRDYWLVTRTYADEGRGVHLHLPPYLFAPHGRLVSLRDWQQLVVRGQQPPVPTYFFRSLRCHAQPPGTPPAGEFGPCQRAAGSTSGAPLWQDRVPNRHDTPTFDYYDDSPQLQVGLYPLVP
jgi:hypothetical protein